MELSAELCLGCLQNLLERYIYFLCYDRKETSMTVYRFNHVLDTNP